MTKRPVLAVILLLACAAAAAAQQVRVNHNRTPLRAEPTSASPVLEFYQAGSALDVIGRLEGWYKVRDPKTGREGYMLATLVDELPADARSPSRPGGQVGVPRVTGPRTSGPANVAARPKPKASLRAFADASAAWMTASESFKAVTGSGSRVQYGGGVQAVNVWRGLYAEATVGYSRLTGSRVFVHQGTVYDLGIPVTITFMPIDVGIGWRAPAGRTLHAYAGGGVSFMNYREESDFANAEDDVSEVSAGFHAAGGLEVRLAAWLHVRAEGRFTSIPDALGSGGASAEFNETNLGGASVAVKLVLGR